MSAWIKMIQDSEASNELRDVLQLAKTPHGTIDNVMRVHSLRPHTMRGHLVLYRAVLHDPQNIIPTWFQETISSYVSLLNGCTYSFENHWSNACHLINNETKSNKIEKALRSGKLSPCFEGYELEILIYAKKLTLTPADIIEKDIISLREKGVSDEEILEANQIICYFNYVNRSINGLGVTTHGDKVGYYRSEK